MKDRNAVRLGKRGGLSTSEAKKNASRLNGAKGGRPKKNTMSTAKTCWVLFSDRAPAMWKAVRILNTSDPLEKPREVLWNGTSGNTPYAWQPIKF